MIKTISNLTISTMQTSYNILRSADVDRTTHTQTSRSGRLRCTLRRMAASAALLLGIALPAVAADYVFMYNGGYLAVDNSGNVIYTTTLSPQCVWTCVSNATYLTASTLSGTSTYLYTTDGNGTRRWLIGSTTDGAAITTSTNAGTARWRVDGNRLFWRNTNSYYAYYRENTWRTSRRNNGNSYGVNAYMSGNNSGTDYRSTTYQATVTTETSISTNPTINGADVLTAAGNSTYTAQGAAYRNGYTNYRFNNADHYYDANGNSFTGTPANATLTTTWSITDNSYATVNNNSGVVTISNLPESDLTLTLTVTVAVSGGTPAAPAGTTLTASKEITIQGTKPSAPIINASGNSVTLSTDATGSTTIRYTLDGSDPTANTGTVYSDAIDLSSSTTSPVTIKAVTVRNGNASDVSEASVTLTLPAPTISVNGDAGTATISATNGTTIYYTTDGSDPTTSSTQYTGSLSGLSMMTTIKAIAMKDGWNNSPVASETVTIPSGTNGGAVTLFDYEPHSWSYYSDPECPIRSLSPADVKITYYGDGIVMSNNNDYTAGTNNYVSPGNANYVGGAKVNVGGENENTFIYYKTLERGDATQTAWTFSSDNQSSAASRCPYTPIPNPFQVRPTYGSRGSTDANDFTGWRGFQCWRLKSVTGGAVYSAASGGTALAVNAIINAGTQIYFAPNNEYGMEVELEAVWARAYVVKGNQGGANNILSQNVGVERNFMTLTNESTYRFDGTNGRYIGNKGYAVTISNYYPNGETGNTGASISGYNNMTLGADTKFENITFSSMGSYTLTAANHSLTIGRGCSGTINYVSGINGNVTSPNYTLRIESGTINYLSFLKGYSTTGGTATDASGTLGGTPNIKGVLGCDYDRATDSGITNNLIINNGVYYGYSVSEGNGITYSDNAIIVHVKSGKIGNGFTINNNYKADAADAFYIGIAGQRVRGHRKLFLEGGEVASIAGGIDATQNQNNNSLTFRMTGGHIRGVVYGGGARSAAYGNRNLIVTGGTITGWIGGGCNGEAYPAGQNSEDTYGGITYGVSNVYFGGTAVCGGTGSNITINGSLGGTVFGAGKGVEGNTTSGRMSQGTAVVVADDCDIERNVYGGGNFGYAQTSTDVFVSGGTVHGSVFGGSNQNDGPVIDITMKGGTIEGGLYGGSNTTGTISSNVTMNINGGQVGTPSSPGNIHGGGYGQPTVISSNVNITLGASTSSTDWVTVYGNVYGGSALGTVSGNATIIMNKGEINGNLFGGALGDDNNAALVNGNVNVTVHGGKVTGAVFGCNDANGTPKGTVTVTIDGTDATTLDSNGKKVYALQGVYGGGNLAHYNPTTATNGYPKVIVSNCNTSIKDVYGGGNAAAVPQTDVTINGGDIERVFAGGNGESGTPANVGYQNKLEPTTANSYGNGTAVAKIYGGTIVQVFGGSNAHGVIREGGTIDVDKSKATGGYDCDLIVKEIYGGGNEAAGAAGAITIGCTGALTDDHSDHPENIGVTLEGIGSVYGGANKAGVSNNIVLNINSGIVGNVFGGNNQTGTISGTITVNIEKTNSACGWYVGNVFGGGNLADYSGNPKVNIKNGTVSGNVYGGGNGDPDDNTQIKGSTAAPTVIIGDLNPNHSTYQAIVLGDVYGGGNAAKITGNTAPQVRVLNKANTEINNVYGGGNAADVPATDVIIDAGTISGNVFGGGHGDKESLNNLEGESGHSDKAANVTGNTSVQIRGGIINKVFAGSNLNGDIGGTNCTLTIAKSDTTRSPMRISEVYGGGNMADGNATSITIGCTGTWTTTGTNNHSNANDTDNRIGYELEGIGTVYGGANQANIGTDQIASNIVLSINSGMVANVYGGNNTSGTIHGTIQVNINQTSDACGWYVGDVFGGGNLANYSGTPDVNIIAGTVSGSVFGGGNAAGVGGSDVEISGGQVNGSVYGGCNSSGDAGAVTISLTGGQIGTSSTRADVYGGGFGASTTTSGNISVTLGATTVYGDLYGGSAFGSVNADANNTTTLTISNNSLHGTIYGGGKGSNEGDSITATSNGNVQINYNVTNDNLTGLYGGANLNGLVVGNIEVNVKGNVGTEADSINIFGGGLGHATATSGNVIVNVGTADVKDAPIVYGDVYGGSALGNVNDAVADATTVNIYNGTVHGNIYGGGLGDATVNANGYLDTTQPTIEAIVNGTVHVNIGHETNANSTPTIDGEVFGCNNLAGTPKGNVYVDVYRTAHTGPNTYPSTEPASAAVIPDLSASACAISAVYGGGNLAHYTTSLEGASTHVHIHNCNNTIQYVYGGGNAANSPATDVIIEGGRFEYVFGGGNGAGTGNPGANVEGDSKVTLNGGIINYVFGGSNTLGVVNGTASIYFDVSNETNCTRMVKELYGGGNQAPGGSVDLTIPCGVSGLNLVFGGSRNADIGVDTLFNKGIKKNITLTIEGGNQAQVFGGNNQGGTIWGDVTLNLKGGTITDAFGGNNAGGNVKGTITVNVTDAESTECPLILTNVFGGGKDAAYTPADATISSPIVNINHIKSGNSISGSVFGGGQGSGATVTSNPVVTIGDGNNAHYVTIGGNVYGGGDAAAVEGSTTVEMKNAHSTAANLFGGGNAASVSVTASVTLTNGHVTTGIYGGCNASGSIGGKVTVNVNNGTVGTDASHTANIHGGGLGNATRTLGSVEVNIGAENAQSGATIYGDVYGGSAKGKTNGENSLTTGATTAVTLNAGTINGSLYGGGLGDNTYAADVFGPVAVVVNSGTVIGSVYGCNNANGAPQSTVTVDIYGTDDPVSGYALANVFGGGNAADYGGTPVVTVHNCDNSIAYVYGGGNAATVYGTDVTIYGGNTIGNVFGGCYGANVTTNGTSVKIYGGTIGRVFGGNNQSGSVTGDINVTVDKQTETGHSSCAMKIGEVYSGGNVAASNAGTITIGCTGTLVTLGEGERYGYEQEGIGYVYGGANQADIGASGEGNESNIEININSGIVGNVFGGNNTSGTIYGTITVNIEKDAQATCADNWYVGNVFGGGNLATYTGSPTVNITNGTVSGNVYGGGAGELVDGANRGLAGKVTGNPQVTIGDNVNGHTVTISGDVYGGGDAADVDGTPVIVVNDCNTQISGDLYGGGNAADVSGTSVTINAGTINRAFGGGHGDKDASNPAKYADVNGNVVMNVYGGTFEKVFAGSNSKGDITGTSALTINKTGTCDMKIGEVYGGGNEAAGNAASVSIGCTGTWTTTGTNNHTNANTTTNRIGYELEGIGTVYGGANAADIGTSSRSSNITLNINSGIVGRVFGGNNTSGDIHGTITVNVQKDNQAACAESWYVGNVFGGGNLAQYTSPNDNDGNPTYPRVNIINGTVSGNVYGGGAGVLATGDDRGQAGKVTGNPQVTIGDNDDDHTVIITGDVYGGGDAADVDGTPVIVVNDCNTQISGDLYGGGNAADVNGTSVTINAGSIRYAFGGGHGDKNASSPAKYADVKGNVVMNVYGGTFEKVFAGSNSKGDITGSSALTINKTGNCEMKIGEVYGGGNEADGNAGTVTIGCTGDLVAGTSGHAANPGNIGTTLEGIGAVYGGARAADIGTSSRSSHITLNINSGMIGTVYGGNNEDGDIYGNIQVNINKTSDACGWYVGNVYGGGNLADYTNSGNNYPQVNIQNGAVSGNVFGGGYGSSARVTANPQVNLLGGTVSGNVYGGGEAAPVTGNPTVTASGTSVTATRLYGGGLGSTAVVTGSTTVTVSGGTYDYVFGGGEAADMSGSVIVNIQGGTINHDVYGGGALANTNIGNATNYGQNNETISSTSSNTTTVNVTGGVVTGDVYGGGLGQRRGYNGTLTTDNIDDIQAYVYGDVTVNLNQNVEQTAKGAVINRIFGSNNVYGTPLGSVTVNVYATQNSATNDIGSKISSYDVAAVYGGGNLAAYVPNTAATPTNVIIDGCGLSSIEYVYGGGNAAPTPATHVEILGSYKISNVFGGGNGKDNITYNGQSTDNPGADVGIRQVSQTEYNASQYKYADSEYGISANDHYVMYGDTAETVIGTTDVIIMGGTVGQLFGGSNTKGDIIKEAKVTLGDENVNTCPLEVDGVYGGSNEAYMSGSAGIEMKCVNGMKEIYGGSRMADVHNDIVLTITGGHYQKVFGGNNLEGLIHGSITVNIEQTGCLPIVIDELYGGGNLAPYSVYGYNTDGTVKIEGDNPKDGPTINIVSCDTIRKVFGGGLGGNAVVVGNPTININMVKGWTDGRYTGTEDTDPYNQYAGTPKNFDHIGDIGTVFGGGNEAKVIGETFVNIGTESSVKVHDVNMATYDVIKTNRTDITNPNYSEPDETVKDLTITVEGVNISGNVYGGGNQADITGSSHITIGPDGEEQQSQGNSAPIRSEQPTQSERQQPTQNAATESQQTRSITPTRL